MSQKPSQPSSLATNPTPSLFLPATEPSLPHPFFTDVPNGEPDAKSPIDDHPHPLDCYCQDCHPIERNPASSSYRKHLARTCDPKLDASLATYMESLLVFHDRLNDLQEQVVTLTDAMKEVSEAVRDIWREVRLRHLHRVTSPVPQVEGMPENKNGKLE